MGVLELDPPSLIPSLSQIDKIWFRSKFESIRIPPMVFCLQEYDVFKQGLAHKHLNLKPTEHGVFYFFFSFFFLLP